MSAYIKFIEGGTNVGAGAIRFLRFGGASGTANLYITYNSFYGIRFVTASGATASVVGVSPVVGNTVELLMTLAANGSVVLQQTINGGAPVVGGVGTAKALPAAWTSPTFEVAAAPLRVAAILSCVVVRGVQSLATMQRWANTVTK